MGSVGKIASDYITRALDTKVIWSELSPGFPAQVMVNENLAVPFKIEVKTVASKEDLFLISCDAQPVDVVNMNRLACKLLEYMKTLGTTDVMTLAAHVGGSDDTIYAAATDVSLVSDLKDEGFTIMNRGLIGGLNGLLVGLAPSYGMRGICLLCNTSGDLPVDVSAARRLMIKVATMLDLNIPLDGLDFEAVEDETTTDEETSNSSDLGMLYR